jgi:hypothetical protein
VDGKSTGNQVFFPNLGFQINFFQQISLQKRHSRHLEGHVNSDSYTPEGDGKSTVGWQSQAESKPPLVQDSREIEMIES